MGFARTVLAAREINSQFSEGVKLNLGDCIRIQFLDGGGALTAPQSANVDLLLSGSGSHRLHGLVRTRVVMSNLLRRRRCGAIAGCCACGTSG